MAATPKKPTKTQLKTLAAKLAETDIHTAGAAAGLTAHVVEAVHFSDPQNPLRARIECKPDGKGGWICE